MFYQPWWKIFFLITLGFQLNLLTILVDGIHLGKLKIAVCNAQFQCKFFLFMAIDIGSAYIRLS